MSSISLHLPLGNFLAAKSLCLNVPRYFKILIWE